MQTSPMPSLQILDENAGLSVVGEVDLATAPELSKALSRSGPDLDLDMSRCTFMDSSGISALIEAKAGSVPGLAIVRPSTAVRRVLDLCGLAEILIAEEYRAGAAT